MNNLYTNEELTQLYEKTYSSVYALAYSIVKNEQDACDLAQDTYLSAFTNVDKLKDIEKFDKWVIQIAANKCKDFLRKKKPTLFSQVGEDDEDFVNDIPDSSDAFKPDAVIENKEKKEIIKNILYSLPEDQRLCLVLYYGQELKISEIAASLGISENTVKSRLNYGKKKMKEQVEELERKGTKLHGITGIGILPLIKQLFASQSFTTPPASAIPAAEVVSSIVNGAQTAKKVVGISKIFTNATSIITKSLTTKIVSSVVATAVVAAGAVAIAKPDLFFNSSNDNVVSEISTDQNTLESVNTDTESMPFETNDESESSISMTSSKEETSSQASTSSEDATSSDDTTSQPTVSSVVSSTSSEEMSSIASTSSNVTSSDESTISNTSSTDNVSSQAAISSEALTSSKETATQPSSSSVSSFDAVSSTNSESSSQSSDTSSATESAIRDVSEGKWSGYTEDNGKLYGFTFYLNDPTSLSFSISIGHLHEVEDHDPDKCSPFQFNGKTYYHQYGVGDGDLLDSFTQDGDIITFVYQGSKLVLKRTSENVLETISADAGFGVMDTAQTVKVGTIFNWEESMEFVEDEEF